MLGYPHCAQKENVLSVRCAVIPAAKVSWRRFRVTFRIAPSVLQVFNNEVARLGTPHFAARDDTSLFDGND